MKNFQMKIILSIYALGTAIISFMGIAFGSIVSKIDPNSTYINTIKTTTIILLALYAIFTIVIAIIEVKKYIELYMSYERG